MSQRDLIRMSDDEVRQLLADERVVNVATLGPDGRPHLAPLWYGFLDGCIAFTTYGRSQKVRNLERDPRVTALVEAGHDYEELRGVELVGTGEVLQDAALAEELGRSIRERYYGDSASGPRYGDLSKRVIVKIVPDKVVSWDHRKLAAVRAAG
jgi:PPOX class probable F420-dependent enzyme